MKTIKLPEGHTWKEVQSPASETHFQCKCGATFIHDMIENSIAFEDGDGSCDDEVAK